MQPAAGALPLEESARRMGGYRWIEARLFEGLGAWVPTVPEPDAKTVLAAHSRQHAWHAELWHERLPRAGAMDPEALTAPASDRVAAFASALVEPEAEDRTIEKLVGAYRVLLPRLIVAYSQHLRLTSEIADAPVVRALRLALRDEVEGWCRGEELIQSLLRSEQLVARAAEHQARLEAILTPQGIGTGGLVGEENGQP